MAALIARHVELAILGGPPTVLVAEPRHLVSSAVRGAVSDFLADAAGDEYLLSDHEGEGVVGSFERAFARSIGAKYAIAHSSGTAALMAILRALAVGPGDEVIVAAYGWGSTVGAVLALGAQPRFADIDAHTACMDPSSAELLVNASTKAIIVTHMFGNPARVVELERIARSLGVALVYDAAQAMGAAVSGEPLGAFGDAVAWSFGRGKLPFAGEGGAVSTNDSALADAIVVASQHPARARREVVTADLRPFIDELSMSLRMHPVAAVMAREGLPDVLPQVMRRSATCERLRSRLSELPGVEVVASSLDSGNASAWYAFPIALRRQGIDGVKAADIANALRAEGVPIEAGPVRIPINLRPRLAVAHGNACVPQTVKQCEAEMVIVSATRWTNVPEARVEQIADAFEKVFTHVALESLPERARHR